MFRPASRLVPAVLALLALPCVLPAQGRLTTAPGSPPRQVGKIFVPRIQQPIVFFTNNVTGEPAKLGRMGLRGNGLQSLLPMPGPSTPSDYGIAIDEKNCLIYYGVQGFFESSIERMNVDGTGRTTIVAPSWTGFVAGSVALDHASGRIFFTSTNGPTRIGSCSLNGSNVKALVAHNAANPIVRPHSLAYDAAAKKLYWFDDAAKAFRMANENGSSVQLLHATGPVTSHAIDVVHGDLYWTVSDKLWRAPIDGSAPPCVIVTGPDDFDPLNLAVHPELDLIVWSSLPLEISWTSRTTPCLGPGISPAPVFSAPVPHKMHGMSLARGPFFCPVSATAAGPQEGRSALQLQVLAGAPGVPFRVELVELNGERASAHLGTGILDAEGTARIDAPAPASLRGARARIALELLDPASGERIRRELEVSLP